MQGLQRLLTGLDSSVVELKESVEGMRPAYNQALQLLSSSNLVPPGQNSKNNLVSSPPALRADTQFPIFCTTDRNRQRKSCCVQKKKKETLLFPPLQVFHGIEPDALELQMASEPEFCRDVLETRVKMVFREHLRISREMPLTQVRKRDAKGAIKNSLK